MKNPGIVRIAAYIVLTHMIGTVLSANVIEAQTTATQGVKHPGLNTQPDDPTFQLQQVKALTTWVPYCPAKTQLIRMDTEPHCLWGTTPMQHKPNLGQFKCQTKKWYKHLPNCAVDPYLSIGIGQH